MSPKKVTRKDLRRFLKKELITLAKENDFGFSPKSKMSKIELVNLIFISPQFKVMKDKLQMKPKRKVSQAVLDNLQKGREMRKKDKNVDSNVDFYSTTKVPENKKEEKLVKPKEEIIDEETSSFASSFLSNNNKPQFIETQQIVSGNSQVEIENEMIPYESVVVDNERVRERKDQAILQKGANAVTGLSGEKKSIISTEKIDKQQRNLELSTFSPNQQIQDDINNIEFRIVEEHNLLGNLLGDDKNNVKTQEKIEFLNKLKELFTKIKDEKTNKEEFIEEQKSEAINNVDPDLLVTLKDINVDINDNNAKKQVTVKMLEKMLDKLKREELLEISSARSGKKPDIIKQIINESIFIDEVFVRAVKFSGSPNIERSLISLRNLEGTSAALSAHKISTEEQIKQQKLDNKQNSINDIKNNSGNSQYIIESQKNLDKQQKLNDINHKRNATEQQKAQFDLRLP